ncbi:putative Na+/H+ antiporter [Caballeronia sordidicola]|uniref:Putative membrane protein n=1 Tax=Caballeronia sordidicola TaxID=196367 RepID=A0A242M2J7_CABSO|nr:putative Na+/H+ antiporter [Caballeronia sordidicola]OTP65301.1 putative membrane protein [Caballeronia sordidicola]
MPHSVELVALLVFSCALVHTFAAKHIGSLAARHPAHAGLFHFLGEIEVVFGLWGMILCLLMWGMAGSKVTISYLETREFTEPLFVFVIMVIAASRPILEAVTALLVRFAKLLPVRAEIGAIWLSLTFIPVLGSFITEPAAMTLAALILKDRLFTQPLPERWKYLSLAVLFVNISIGGTLTAFAAPPVLMVEHAWGWDTTFMASTFGWKAIIAVLVNSTLLLVLMSRFVPRIISNPQSQNLVSNTPTAPRMPVGITLVHLVFLTAVVLNAHHAVIFVGLFLFFLGYTEAYERYQSPLLLRESLLVAFFLGGLVVLGGLQQWWLQPIVRSLDVHMLYAGATALTAIMDNAAITYLGSLIEGLSTPSKSMLVAGAVTGGGLTVIANAPNPAGFAIVRAGFSGESVGPLGLFAAAIPPTLIASIAFLFL